MTDELDTPKIQIDSDWKAEAQAEKERLTQQAEAKPADGEATAGGLPAASFEALVSTMAAQAMFAMGLVPDPRTGQRVQHLEVARHHVDLLSVIEEKTKGNLTDSEEKLLSSTLYELRSSYITVSQAVRGR